MESIKNYFRGVFDYYKNNRTVVVISGLIFLLNLMIFILGLNDVIAPHSPIVWVLYILLFLTLNIIAMLGLVYIDKKKLAIEKVYLIFGLIYGTILVFVTPMGRIPDEPAHFWRAYELSELRFFTETTESGEVGYYLPNDLMDTVTNEYDQNAYSKLIDDLGEQLDDERSYQRGPADKYFVLNYVPQVIGIWMGRILHLPIIPITYLARLCNLVFCVFVVYYCLKYLPVLKKFIFLLGFTPMVMHEFSSVSADGAIICGALVLMTYSLAAIYGKVKKIDWKGLAIVLLSCLMLCVTKPTYAPMCCILFFIPKECFGSTKRKLLSIFGIGAITILALILITVTFPELDTSNYVQDVNIGAQLSHIIQHPFKYCRTLMNSIAPNIVHYISTGIGSSLEWFSVSIFSPTIIMYAVMFILIIVDEKSTCYLGIKIFALCSMAIMIVLIFTAMYLVWTPVGGNIIYGVQGRYFVPIVPLLPLVFMPSGKAVIKKSLGTAKHASLYACAFYSMAQVVMSIVLAHL